MATGDQINLQPHDKREGTTLPCDGQVGDLYVFTPLDTDPRQPDTDVSALGQASLWFCSKAADRETPAIWQRVTFDGWFTCSAPPPPPPQDRPELREG